jgi:DNA-binding transcriptional MocR family regulator
VTRPEGGFVVWAELPESVDAMRLYAAALRERIGIAPGALFTAGGDKFTNCVRLNTAYWSRQVEEALKTVGRIACGMA